MLRTAYNAGARGALEKLGIAQPSIQSAGVKLPAVSNSSLGSTKLQSRLQPTLKLEPNASSMPSPLTLGAQAAKIGADVGMGASSGRAEGPGAVPGEPSDAGRRQRSVVDRTFQANEDNFATSSMPLPGANVSP